MESRIPERYSDYQDDSGNIQPEFKIVYESDLFGNEHLEGEYPHLVSGLRALGHVAVIDNVVSPQGAETVTERNRRVRHERQNYLLENHGFLAYSYEEIRHASGNSHQSPAKYLNNILLKRIGDIKNSDNSNSESVSESEIVKTAGRTLSKIVGDYEKFGDNAAMVVGLSKSRSREILSGLDSDMTLGDVEIGYHKILITRTLEPLVYADRFIENPSDGMVEFACGISDKDMNDIQSEIESMSVAEVADYIDRMAEEHTARLDFWIDVIDNSRSQMSVHSQATEAHKSLLDKRARILGY